MQRHDFSNWQCSVARTTDLIGDWWTPLILRDASRGIDTFDGFQKNLNISRNTLTQRLVRLVDEGMLDKIQYNERPKRYNYKLTEKGADFVPVLLAMTRWGDKWLFDGRPPYKVRHKSCGHDVQGVVVCSECGEELALDNIEPANEV